MRFSWSVALLVLLAGAAQAQPVLQPPDLPGLAADVRANYAQWLLTETPRAFAIGANGAMGWFSGGDSLAHARERALQLCAEHGGSDCRLYAEDLSVIWPGRVWRPPAPPAAEVDGINYGFIPDPRFLWHGPGAARGVLVWSHGANGAVDSRGQQPPPITRAFNDAGFDVIRFDRAPLVDNPIRAAGWLRDGLRRLRAEGYAVVIAAGQSRGAWTSLQILDTPGLADVVVALSPAAHGSGGSPNLTAQDDDLRALVAEAAPSRTRVAVAQFTADPFMSDAQIRLQLLERLRGKEAALLMIDRPPGLSGHFGGLGSQFARRFGACLLRFATDPAPPATCSGPE